MKYCIINNLIKLDIKFRLELKWKWNFREWYFSNKNWLKCLKSESKLFLKFLIVISHFCLLLRNIFTAKIRQSKWKYSKILKYLVTIYTARTVFSEYTGSQVKLLKLCRLDPKSTKNRLINLSILFYKIQGLKHNFLVTFFLTSEVNFRIWKTREKCLFLCLLVFKIRLQNHLF